MYLNLEGELTQGLYAKNILNSVNFVVDWIAITSGGNHSKHRSKEM